MNAGVCNGSLTAALTDVTLLAVAAVLLCGGWLGVTVTSDLIALRTARREVVERVEAGRG